MFINPSSNKMIGDMAVIFTPLLINETGPVQARLGRYVVNWRTVVNECLILDYDDNIIDGYCGVPVFQLLWKGKPFLHHLCDLRNIPIPDDYKGIDYEIISDEFSDEMDKEYWTPK